MRKKIKKYRCGFCCRVLTRHHFGTVKRNPDKLCVLCRRLHDDPVGEMRRIEVKAHKINRRMNLKAFRAKTKESNAYCVTNRFKNKYLRWQGKMV